MSIRVHSWLRPFGPTACLLLASLDVTAQSTLPPASSGFGGAHISPNRAETIARPLRYRPDGTDFVAVAGDGHFNRPLYAARTSFRVDAGDRPEFALNLPRKGGVLRLGVAGSTPLWLHDAATVEMRYRPGSVIYTISDPALGETTLTVSVQALREQTAALWRFEASGPLPGPLVWAFTGGDRKSANARNGDIIAGRDPAEIMTPTRAEATGNTLGPEGDRYLNRAGAFDFLMSPSGATGVVGFDAWSVVPDPPAWSDPVPAAPVFQGRIPLTADAPAFLGVFATAPETSFTTADLPALWAETEAARAALVSRVIVDTPDPYLNALPGALLVAADAVWDPPHVMHGAIAWRLPLLGWRGPAALDTLGWHERFRAYARHWIAQQNIDPNDFPDPPAADPAKNLATDDWRALHGFGSIPARHYDMALGFVDLLLRHLMWTGDLEFAREVWPFLERHLAWEKRCFDRDGLYEGYAAIWASDALTYNGGGTTHASALNYWHRLMAARLAERIGEDPTPHAAEAARIHAAMMDRLWDDNLGVFGEYIERAGLQRVHTATALWSFYHVTDSAVLDFSQAQRMAQTINLDFRRLPVTGPNVPEGSWMLPTTFWQPYEWSLNNVVPSENAHTALAFWQAYRPDLAWSLWQGTLLDAMYLSSSPGNIPNLSFLDVHRRETYRDFADPIGTFSRALVEGLFGVRPDAIGGVLTLAPGIPPEWDHATLRTPDFTWSGRRQGPEDHWSWAGKIPTGIETLRLRLPARGRFAGAWAGRASLPEVSVQTDSRGGQWVELEVPASEKISFRVQWDGDSPTTYDHILFGETYPDPRAPTVIPTGQRWEPIPLSALFNDRVEAIFSHDYLSPRSPYVSLRLPKQGLGSWSDFNAHADLDDAGLRQAAAAGQGTVTLPNGATFETVADAEAANVAFVSWWDNFPRELSTPLHGNARHLLVVVAGSTNPMHSWIENGEIVVTYTDGSTAILPLTNPTTWWPIERDYVIDDYAFRRVEPVPWRLELATGRCYQPEGLGGRPRGGAATVLTLPLDATKTLQSLTVRALSTEVVVGLLAASLAR